MKKFKAMILPLLTGFIILLMQPSASSMQEDKVAEENDKVAQLQESVQRSIEVTRLNTPEHKEIEGSIILIGNIEAGKSALTHYLGGGSLNGEKDPKGGFKLSASSPSPIKIHDGIAGTRFISTWYNTEQKILYKDCPGFEAPEGPSEKIINAFSLQQSFANSTPMKVVLVVPEASLKEFRCIHFFEMLSKLTELFQNRSQLEDCVSLVITKQRDTDPNTILKTILETETKGRSEYLQKPEVKALLEFFANKAETRVASFPYPAALGPYEPRHREEILSAILSSKYIQNPAINITIDDSANNLVEQFAKKLNDDLAIYMKTKVGPQVVRYYQQRIEEYQGGTAEDLRKLLGDSIANLHSLQNISSETPMDFANRLSDIFDVEDIRKAIGQLEALKGIKGDVPCYPKTWANGLFDTIEAVKHLTAAPQSHYAEGTLIINGLVIGMSDVNRALREYAPIIVGIHGLNTFLFDVNFANSSGIFLNVIAPCFKVVGGARTINLKGANGTDGDPGIHGTGGHGKPGGLGRNGGHLYGKTYRFDGPEHLTINTSGGNGGIGGNGGNGKHGVNGVDGDLTIYVTQGNDRHYNDQGTPGTDGQDGGQGGQRGYGGFKGTSLIEGCKGWSWVHISQDGLPGADDGIPGQGGNAARHGKHCTGTLQTGLARTVSVPTRVSHPNFFGKMVGAHTTGYKDQTVYDGTHWSVQLGLLPAVSTNAGSPGQGLNDVNLQLPPPVQTPLDRDDLCKAYKKYYDQQAALPYVGPVIGEFPNLLP